MTPEQQAELRAAARTDPACAVAYAARDLDALASLLSVGRVRFNDSAIGNGIILDVLGKEKGNVVLDAVRADESNRYVITLLDQGRLEPRTKTFQEALVSMVQVSLITQDEANKLLATAQEPDLLTRMDVKDALFDDAGNEVQE
jgi:hypothetical protein